MNRRERISKGVAVVRKSRHVYITYQGHGICLVCIANLRGIEEVGVIVESDDYIFVEDVCCKGEESSLITGHTSQADWYVLGKR